MSVKNSPKKTHAHSTETLNLTQKNQSKICSLKVRRVFESKISNRKINRNTKTTHQKPLSLTISKKQK